jgi:hypothetical protein
MTDLDLAAIRARAAAATPGPWLGDPTGTVCAAVDVVPDGQGGEILPPDGPMEVAECYRRELPDERARNADFIAHARSDVPALLDALNLLEVQIRDLHREAVYTRPGTCSDCGQRYPCPTVQILSADVSADVNLDLTS